MAEERDCRLETACRCLDLPRPSKEEWLKTDENRISGLASIAGSLSDPVRLRILEMLSNGDLYVCIIQYLLDEIKYSKLSYHLDILKKADLISSQRDGNFVLYHLTEKGALVSRTVFELALSPS